ncbi:MAG TPA: fatty acid desaturase [Lacipirellulaceae bacterium]|jgi:fatty acid desaturase
MTEHPKRRPAAAAKRGSATTRAEIAQLHDFDHWPAWWMWPLVVALFALQAAAGREEQTCWPLLLLIVPAISAIMFVFVLSFHDASHGRLYPLHWLNETHGHIVGTFSFTPLAVYRYAHARHHAQLGRPGDPELWPFNSPHISRPLRILAAAAEVLLGVVYTPLLFLRSVLIGELSPRERRLILRGYILCAAVWIAVLTIVYDFDLWMVFLVASIIPMAISGTLQTLNKFEQHLGLHGETVLGLTRTVVDEHPAAELVSAAMLFNDYHGTHHRYAKIPYYKLPHATPYTLSAASEPCPVFPSVASATLDMLRCLADPKVGPQWRELPVDASTPQPEFTGQYAA